ncbi:MAG: hypothetical protein GVY36_16535 [Verrucomicrobia bacterium]|jgi:hypothetical protein|nr:hypothetical protein [Verrucomicrobiota bacterium]
MHPNNKFVISEGIFAPRLTHGPLDRWERLYREFLSCEFWELLDVDPWLKTAGPSPRGRRVLVPLVRRVLGHQGQLPADMLEWVGLYQQLAKTVLAYFNEWSESGGIEGVSLHPRQHGLRLVGN